MSILRCLTFILSLFFITGSVFANESERPTRTVVVTLGGDSSGGGQSLALKFKEIGEEILDEIHSEASLKEILAGVDLKALAVAIKETKVLAIDEVSVRIVGKSTKSEIVSVEAAYHCDLQTIFISKKELPQDLASHPYIKGIVFHEYLRATGSTDDNAYAISVLYQRWLKQKYGQVQRPSQHKVESLIKFDRIVNELTDNLTIIQADFLMISQRVKNDIESLYTVLRPLEGSTQYFVSGYFNSFKDLRDTIGRLRYKIVEVNSFNLSSIQFKSLRDSFHELLPHNSTLKDDFQALSNSINSGLRKIEANLDSYYSAMDAYYTQTSAHEGKREFIPRGTFGHLRLYSQAMVRVISDFEGQFEVTNTAISKWTKKVRNASTNAEESTFGKIIKKSFSEQMASEAFLSLSEEGELSNEEAKSAYDALSPESELSFTPTSGLGAISPVFYRENAMMVCRKYHYGGSVFPYYFCRFK